MYSFGPIATLVGIVSSIVTVLVNLLSPLVGTAAPVAAVIALTVCVRALLVPVGWRQARAEVQRRRIAPKVADLRRRFRHNPQRLQQETLRLHRAEGVSPLAGCLPSLVQAPVFIAVYGVFLSRQIDGEANHLLEAHWGAVSLGDRLPDVIADPTAVLVFAGLAAVLAVVAWLQRRTTPKPATEAETPTAVTVQRLTRFLPFLVLAAVPVVPLAAVVYLTTTTSWTVGERVVLRRLAEKRIPAT